MSPHAFHNAPGQRLPDAIVDAAIDWSVKLDFSVPTPETRQAFEHWLAADALHAQAWNDVRAASRPFAGVPPPLARATLATAQVQRARGRSRRQVAGLLGFSGLAVGAGLLVREHAPWQRLIADASTATGEQRSVQLADGTVVLLNTDSAVRWDLAREQRTITVLRGETLVSTGADLQGSGRPLWVQTPAGRLQPSGTRFIVRLDEQRSRVSVLEGAVQMLPARGAGQLLRAGESRWMMADGTAPADLLGFEADSWADGVVAGKNIRMADLLREFARYRPGTIVCDARIADRLVSGLFHIRDTDQALQFLAQTQRVRVRYLTRYWVSVEPLQA